MITKTMIIKMYSNIFPLGKLSKNQIEKGKTILKKIEKEIKTTKNKQKLLSLSNEFYTMIPHIHIKVISTMKDVSKEEKLLTYMLM